MTNAEHSWVSFLPIVVAGIFGLWVLWQWLKRSDEPGSLLIRWLVTAVVLGSVLSYAARKTQAQDDFGKGIAVILSMFGGLIMVFVWRQKICDFVGDMFTSLYTGGSAEVDPAPFYSIAIAKRKRGQYHEAIEEVRKQLERFPTDFTGWMLLAEIQAEELKEFGLAQATIDELLSQEGHAPKNIAFALNRVADWHLRWTHDRSAAQAALERIIQLLPDTEQAQLAHQRLAHLTPEAMLAVQDIPAELRVMPGIERIGLQTEPIKIGPVDEDPSQVANNLVKHLEQFPLDSEAREKLALLYANHYQRLDLATDQLEQLIAFPNQLPKQVVRWLNLLADLQVRLTGTVDLARATLQRIPELFPKTAAAENAVNRMAYLKLELRPAQEKPGIKLGSYEQNLGLKSTPAWKRSSE